MSEFLRHGNCPKCGSKDNLAVYTDGVYCFGCNYSKGESVRPGDFALPRIRPVGMPKRGIPESVVLKYRSGVEVVDGIATRFHFPNYKDGKLVGSKYRIIDDGSYTWEDKQFRWLGDSAGLFGMQTAKDSGAVIIHEGECYTPDVEVLTRKGWVSFDNYEGQEIAQYVESVSNESSPAVQNCTGHIEWVYPTSIVSKQYSGDIHTYAGSGRSYSMSVTPGHNMVYRRVSGECFKSMASAGMPANNCVLIRYPEVHELHVPNEPNECGTRDKPVTATRYNELRVITAVSADAGVTYGSYGQIHCDFNLVKQRKIDRLREIVDALKIDAAFCVHTNNPRYTRVRFTLPRKISIGRLFPMQWISELTWEEREIIIRELKNWDGYENPQGTHVEYVSKYKHNADFVQTIACLNGYYSTISPFTSGTTSKGDTTYYKVYIYYSAKPTTVANIRESVEHYDGLVCCVSVPSGMLLVRHKDCISVCGNCDAMAGDVMTGVTHTNVSVTHGAKGAADDIKACLPWLEKFESVILSFDNDESGRKATEECVKLFSPGKCRVIQHTRKDANEYLIAGETAVYCTLVLGSKSVKPAGLIDPLELKELTRKFLFERDNWKGIPSGIRGFDKICGGLRPGTLITVYGGTGLGKTAFVRQIAYNVLQQGLKVLFIPLEMRPQEIATQMLEMWLKRRIIQYDLGSLTISPDEYEAEFLPALGNLHTLSHFGAMSIEDMKHSIIHSVAVDGCRLVVLDHKDAAVNSGKEEDSNSRGIDNLMGKLKEVSMEHGITSLVVSHISRSTTDRDDIIPDLNRIRGSQGVAQNSDIVFGVTRKRDSNILEVITKKGDRFTGGSGSFKLEYNLKTLSYEELGEDDNGKTDKGKRKDRKEDEEEDFDFIYEETAQPTQSVRETDCRTESVLDVRTDECGGEHISEVHTRLEISNQVWEGGLCGEQGVSETTRQAPVEANKRTTPDSRFTPTTLQLIEENIKCEQEWNDLW